MTELTKTQIERQFDRAARTYDEVAGLQQRMADRLIDSIKSTMDAGAGSLIDLGCGTGYALRQLGSIGSDDWKIYGIDLSSKMIRASRNKTPKAILVQGDLQATTFADHSFDIVFSNAAVQWCDLEQAALEIKRILKPGGRFAISTFADKTLHQWREAFSMVEPDEPSRVHTFLNPAQIKTAIDQAGLRVEGFDRDQIELTYETVSEMFDSIKKLGATNAAKTRSRGLLGREKYAAIMSHFNAMLKRDKTLSVTFDCVSVVGGN